MTPTDCDFGHENRERILRTEGTVDGLKNDMGDIKMEIREMREDLRAGFFAIAKTSGETSVAMESRVASLEARMKIALWVLGACAGSVLGLVGKMLLG